MEEVENIQLTKQVRRLFNLLEIRIFDLSQTIQLTGHKFNCNQFKDTLQRQYSIFQQTKPIFIQLKIEAIYDMIHQISLNYTRISSILLQNISQNQSKYQKLYENQTNTPNQKKQINNQSQLKQTETQEQKSQNFAVKCKKLGGISLYFQNYMRGIQTQSKKKKVAVKKVYDQRQLLKQLINAEITHKTDVQKISQNDEISKFIKQGNLKHELYNHIEYQKDLEEIFKFFKESQQEALNFLVESKNAKQNNKQQIIIGFHQLLENLSQKKKAQEQIMKNRVKKILESLRNLNVELKTKLSQKEIQIQKLELLLNVEKKSIGTQTQKTIKTQTKIYEEQKADFESVLGELKIKYSKMEELYYNQTKQKSILGQKIKKKDLFNQQLKMQIQKFKQYFRDNKLSFNINKIIKKQQKTFQKNIQSQIYEEQLQEQSKQKQTAQKQKKDRKKKIRYSTMAQTMKTAKLRQGSLPSQHALQEKAINILKQKLFNDTTSEFEFNRNLNNQRKQKIITTQKESIVKNNLKESKTNKQLNQNVKKKTLINYCNENINQKQNSLNKSKISQSINQQNQYLKQSQEFSNYQCQNRISIQQQCQHLQVKQVNQQKNAYKTSKSLRKVPQLVYLTKFIQENQALEKNQNTLLQRNSKLLKQILINILPSMSKSDRVQPSFKSMICQQNQQVIKKQLAAFAKNRIRYLKKQGQISKLDIQDKLQIQKMFDVKNKEQKSKNRLKDNINKAYQKIRISGKGFLVNQQQFNSIFDNLLYQQPTQLKSHLNSKQQSSCEDCCEKNLNSQKQQNNNLARNKNKSKARRDKSTHKQRSVSIQSSYQNDNYQLSINGTNIRQSNQQSQNQDTKLPSLNSNILKEVTKSINDLHTKNNIKYKFQINEIGKNYKKKLFEESSIKKINKSNIIDCQNNKYKQYFTHGFKDSYLMRVNGQNHFNIAQLLKSKGLISQIEFLQIQKIKCSQKGVFCTHYTKFHDFLKKHIHQITHQNSKRQTLSLHISNIDGKVQNHHITEDLQLQLIKNRQNHSITMKHQSKAKNQYIVNKQQGNKNQFPALKRKVIKM